MKSQIFTTSSFVLAGILSMTSACAGSKAEPVKAPSETAKAATSAKAESPAEAKPAALAAGEESGNVDAVAVKADPTLELYGQIHAHLVADNVSEAVASAKLLAASANEAVAAAGESQKKALAEIHAAANAMATADIAASEDVRKQFGEVSKAVIELLIADPSLAAGRHTFQCDMAQGFKKWVQASDDLQNPYMGQRMPACGSKTELSL